MALVKVGLQVMSEQHGLVFAQSAAKVTIGMNKEASSVKATSQVRCLRMQGTEQFPSICKSFEDHSACKSVGDARQGKINAGDLWRRRWQVIGGRD